jgi:hypothetical protein
MPPKIAVLAAVPFLPLAGLAAGVPGLTAGPVELLLLALVAGIGAVVQAFGRR